MCSTLFLLIISKSKFACAARLFVFPLLLFCTTKMSNVLVTHYFYGEIVVCVYPVFCFLCSCSLLFFTAEIWQSETSPNQVPWLGPVSLPNFGFLWVFFKYPKISKNRNLLFFPVKRTNTFVLIVWPQNKYYFNFYELFLKLYRS